MRASVAGFLCVLFISGFASASDGVPGPGTPSWLHIRVSRECEASATCPNGRLGFFLEEEFPPGAVNVDGLIPNSQHGTIEWVFGDGTTVWAPKYSWVQKDYPEPGNYLIEATLTDSRGTRKTKRAMVIATSPSRLDVSGENIPWPPYPSWICWNCVRTVEGSGPVAVTVVRDLDLTRTVTANAYVWFGTPWWGPPSHITPLTFSPGVLEQSFSLTLPDVDDVYSGSRFHQIQLRDATGGTLTGFGRVWVEDDDPRPTMTLEPEVTVREGDTDQTPFAIRALLTSPMGVDVTAMLDVFEGSAKPFEDFGGADINFSIKAGETSGLLTYGVRGDTDPEPDETFEVEYRSYASDANPIFAGTRTKVTIVNDDAAVDPQENNVFAGTDVTLTLDIGSPYQTPMTAIFWTSDENVVPAPGRVVIPAGATRISVVATPRAGGTAQIGANVPDRTTRPATVTVTSSPRRRSVRR